MIRFAGTRGFGNLASLAEEGSLFAGAARDKLEQLQAELLPLAERYDVVVANPPYMGSKNMNKWLNAWVKQHYADVKGDLFSCFMVRNSEMGNDHAQMGFMTPYVWMFISTYEKLRKFVIGENTITSLIQLEYSGFAGATVPICTFTLQKGYVKGYKGSYIRLSDFPGADQQAPRVLEALANPTCSWFYKTDCKRFGSIPGSPISYWASNAARDAYSSRLLKDVSVSVYGLFSCDNKRFHRYWYECSKKEISFKSYDTSRHWVPHNKGGGFRKWAGNKEYVVRYENNGQLIREHRVASGQSFSLPGEAYYFKPHIAWSMVSSGKSSFRLFPENMTFDIASPSLFLNKAEHLYYALGLLNSTIAGNFMEILNPTLNNLTSDVLNTPFLLDESNRESVDSIVRENIELANRDWDSNETSWDFSRHPLI